MKTKEFQEHKQIMNTIYTFLVIGSILILTGAFKHSYWLFGIGLFILIIYSISLLYESNKLKRKM